MRGIKTLSRCPAPCIVLDMKRSIAVLAACLSAGAFLRAETYPTAGGDIATATGWGGTMPASTAAVDFPDGVYTASQDAEFGSIQLDSGATFDFTATPGRKITLNASSSSALVFNHGVSGGANGTTLILKGGTWDMPAGGDIYFGYSSGRNPRANRTILLSDGVCITNVANLYASNSEFGNLLRFTGGSSIFCSGKFYASHGSARDVRVEILDGSTVQALRFGTDEQPTQGGGNSITVSGAGSSLTATATGPKQPSVVGTHLDGHALYVTNGAALSVANGYMALGTCWSYSATVDRASHRNVLHLANGATADVMFLHIGAFTTADGRSTFTGGPQGIGSCSNEVRLLSGARLSCRDLFIGGDVNSCGNRMTVDGATLAMIGTVESTHGLHIGHAGWGNELVFTNVTTFSSTDTLMPQFWIGGAISSSNNTFRLTGAATHAYFDGQKDIFGPGTGNELVIENGAFYETADTRCNWSRVGTNATIRVQGGGRMKVDRTMYVGAAGSGYGCGNRLYVGPGGTFINGAGILIALNSAIAETCPMQNGVVVSNGMVNITGTDGQLTASTNCYVQISGTNPVVTVGGVCTVLRLGRLTFNVPKCGFAATPLTVKRLVMEEGATLEVDCSSRVRTETPQTLVSSTQVMVIPASVLEAANAGLGYGRHLYLADGNKALVLRADPPGTQIRLR